MDKPQAIVFDYGRVLVGPLDPIAFDAELDALAAEHGLADGRALWEHIYISEAWEAAKRGRLSHEAFWHERLAALGIESADDQHAFKRRLFHYWGLYPAMRGLLDVLKGEYRLAVLSNTSRRDFADYLARARGLTDLFDVVVSSAEEGVAKPEPAIYYTLLRRLGLRAENVLFVDDLKRNTDAAAAFGIPVVVFTTPRAFRGELVARGLLRGDIDTTP